MEEWEERNNTKKLLVKGHLKLIQRLNSISFVKFKKKM